jgi:hypothetical protein
MIQMKHVLLHHLDRRVVGVPSIDEAIEKIREATSVTIHRSGSIIVRLLQEIGNSKTIESLTIDDCIISDPTIIFAPLEQNESIKTIDVTGHNFSSIESISKTLLTNNTISTLKMNYHSPRSSMLHDSTVLLLFSLMNNCPTNDPLLNNIIFKNKGLSTIELHYQYAHTLPKIKSSSKKITKTIIVNDKSIIISGIYDESVEQAEYILKNETYMRELTNSMLSEW